LRIRKKKKKGRDGPTVRMTSKKRSEVLEHLLQEEGKSSDWAGRYWLSIGKKGGKEGVNGEEVIDLKSKLGKLHRCPLRGRGGGDYHRYLLRTLLLFDREGGRKTKSNPNLTSL